MSTYGEVLDVIGNCRLPSGNFYVLEKVTTANGRATGVITSTGQHLPADVVVLNPDLPVAYRDLLPANGRILENDRSPQRKVGELDNRGSHFYLALYWARALAEQTGDAGLRETFAPLARDLEQNESRIVGELNGVQGKPVDVAGYYHPDPALTARAMRPSPTFNAILAAISG